MFKQTCYAVSLLLFSCSAVFANANRPAAIQNYVEQYKALAIREMYRTGIPASIKLAQGIHESSSGQGELALNSNNHFGIKCKSEWDGPVYYKKDDDYRNGRLIKSCFRAYDEVKASYVDHSNFLMRGARYARLFQLDRTDYKGWAKGLKKCGYATDPSYAQKLIKTIERYQLFQYDLEAIPNPNAEGFVATAAAEVFEEATEGHSADYLPATDGGMTPPPAMAIPDDYRRGAFKVREEEHQRVGTETEITQYSTYGAAIEPIQAAPSTEADTALPAGQKGMSNAYVLSAPTYDISNYRSAKSRDDEWQEKGSAYIPTYKQANKRRIAVQKPRFRKMSRR